MIATARGGGHGAPRLETPAGHKRNEAREKLKPKRPIKIKPRIIKLSRQHESVKYKGRGHQDTKDVALLASLIAGTFATIPNQVKQKLRREEGSG